MRRSSLCILLWLGSWLASLGSAGTIPQLACASRQKSLQGAFDLMCLDRKGLPSPGTSHKELVHLLVDGGYLQSEHITCPGPILLYSLDPPRRNQGVRVDIPLDGPLEYRWDADWKVYCSAHGPSKDMGELMAALRPHWIFFHQEEALLVTGILVLALLTVSLLRRAISSRGGDTSRSASTLG